MLAETLKGILESQHDGCAVSRWAAEQGPEIVELFAQLQAKKNINVTKLHRAISAETTLPFGKSLFYYHMKGECACQQA